mmetsp:Transcript_20164/g.24448  ORF Transcript_20164/g.24448 Transcript_20164/m.24448 type:complete len:101 (+) Transcript_20164:832-1134(+)
MYLALCPGAARQKLVADLENISVEQLTAENKIPSKENFRACPGPQSTRQSQVPSASELRNIFSGNNKRARVPMHMCLQAKGKHTKKVKNWPKSNSPMPCL